jgi:hypothetical protein
MAGLIRPTYVDGAGLGSADTLRYALDKFGYELSGEDHAVACFSAPGTAYALDGCGIRPSCLSSETWS